MKPGSGLRREDLPIIDRCLSVERLTGGQPLRSHGVAIVFTL